ncbi:MAG: T9SS type A sorting domain-containing protein [Sphingobacteriaceae bacterium]|nr:T9SS type A sorting domain-containing protein [Sphingobacteriaceae bacterium]
MKKLYFIVLSFFAGLTLTNAQILTQSNHAPVAGDAYVMLQQDSLAITPGASGTSAVWNFTSSTRTTIAITNSCAAGTSTLYPVGSVARTVGTAAANYYTSSSTQLNFWGGRFTALSQNVDYAFNSGAVHASYPMVYNTTATSTFVGSVSSGTNNGTISNGTSTVLVDGQGTLNLPNRSFANVLRVNTYNGFDFTLPVSVFTAIGNVKQQSYDYYTGLTNFPSTKLNPLFTIVSSTINVLSPALIATVITTSSVFLNKDYEYVSITENSSEVSELNLFPNPATNNFNLVFVNENAQQVTVEITNALGQLVRKENLANTKGLVNQIVNIAGIEAGVYFVKVNVGEKSSVKKLTIQ